MTIKDIARESGVAVGTVSRVLNNHPDVSEKTKQKVMEIVKKYGFVLNVNAKQLKEQNRKTIVIIEKGISSILLNGLLEKCLNRIAQTSYDVNVVVIDEYENEAQCATKICYSSKPLGIIFLGGTPNLFAEDYEKINVPCVLISNQAQSSGVKNLSSVSIDSEDASYCAVKYLIEHGHKKIGVIGGEIKESSLTIARFSGFKKALDEAGIPFDFDTQYVASKYSLEGGEKACHELIKKCGDVTAVFAMSDAMALGALRAFGDLKISVPEQVSLVGFDGIPLVSYSVPRLTTIRQKQNTLVNMGLDLLFSLIDKKSENKHIITPFELMEGESVKKL